MRYSEHGKIKLHDFDSISEFTNYLDNAQYNRFFDRPSLRSSIEGDPDFTGTRSYEEAQDLLSTGWSASAKRIAARLPIQTSQQTTNRTRPTYGVVGSQASVPRYLQGIPTNMIDRKQVPAKNKIIVINRDIGFAAKIDKKEVEEEGIKALQVIQSLENKGYRVKLNLFFVSSGSSGETIAVRITVKKPEERLSILKVAFSLAHPSMLRRIMFRFVETHPTMETNNFAHGYGAPNGGLMGSIVPKSEYLIPNHIRDVEDFVNNMIK